MAVASVLTSLEERFGFSIDDDEIDGATFATVGSLVAFVDSTPVSTTTFARRKCEPPRRSANSVRWGAPIIYFATAPVLECALHP
jgi:hypothetical protein